MMKYQGLNKEEVYQNKEKYGSNTISSTVSNSFLKKLVESLGDPIIRILLIALGIKTIFLIKNFDWYETIGIVIAITLASLISTISEYGSEKAFIKLQEEASKITCRVIREGQVHSIPIDDVVVNDIVLLSSGDKIPADGNIIEGEISVDESMINGETKEAYKNLKNSEVYRGTVVYSKEAIMKVKKVGINTMYGKIASELQEKSPDSPLKLRLRELAKVISKIGYIGAFLVATSYLFSVIVIANNFDINAIMKTVSNFPVITGHILYALTLCVTIIIVAVPEGLPMMVTLVLSSNMKRMLKNNVLVRKLVGIETAGSLNILFTDKTGTLTNGKLNVIGFMAGNNHEYKTEHDLLKNKHLHDLVKTSILYNNSASYTKEGVVGGNITDRALLNFIDSDKSLKYPKLNTIPFNSKDKYMITVIEKNGQKKLVKGAFEKILPHCLFYYNELGEIRKLDRKKVEERLNMYTKAGIRVLALAISSDTTFINSLRSLTLVGFILIKDSIRKEAIKGVELIKNASIDIVMITGDNKDTAINIGKEVGILKNEYDIVLTSDELNSLSDDDLKKVIPNLKIVARALPQDKSRLIKVSQSMNLVVGMTGDGVNDAPALKKADVGFGMGSGTEVAKEASDIVILDDNILSISQAILYGRTIFKSIRKFIILQLTINMCAMGLSLIGPFIGVNTPVTVIQMLWINMIMDTLAGVAFAYEPALLEYMQEKPKAKDESIINSYMINEILVTGLYSAILCILFLKLPIFRLAFESNETLLTAFFGLFIFIDIFNCFNARTERLNILQNVIKNKAFLAIIIFIIIVQIILIYFGGSLFRTSGLNFFELQLMILLASSVIPFDFIRKIYLKRHGKVRSV